MKNEKPINTAFVKDDNQTTIVCPECSSAKVISVKQFRGHRHKLKIKCGCGHIFKIQLEFRLHRRKDTSLPGTFKANTESTTRDSGIITVVNLSLSGACFEIRGKNDVEIGQKGRIQFTLDDNKNSVFFKNVTIRSIHNNRIGCEFVEDRAYEPALGFYLRP